MEIAVVVTSCDAFQECWEPFIYSINKYWKDCPWNIYIVSNYKSIKSDKVKFITVGEDKGWASNLKKAINHIDADYIIYLQEDYFINQTVDTNQINTHINYCITNDIDYLRLFGPFFDQFAIPETCYALSPKSNYYRLCLQAAIWKKESLDKLLIDGYTGWQFEWKIEKYLKINNIDIKSIVIQSQYYPDKVISYVPDTAVHKGMWTLNGYNYLKEHGFDKILCKRQKEGKIITFIIHNKYKWLRPFSAIFLRFLIKFKINI